MSFLSIENLSISFGGVKAVDDVSFAVKEGSVYAIIGPNGAGKSTIFNLLSRFYEPLSGQLNFAGNDLLELGAKDIARLGIARTFQIWSCSSMLLFCKISWWVDMCTTLKAGGVNCYSPAASWKRNWNIEEKWRK